MSFCFSCLIFWETVRAERFVFAARSTREILEFLDNSSKIFFSVVESFMGENVSLIVVVRTGDLKMEDCVS